MKKILNKTLVLLFLILTVVPFVACLSDSDNSKHPDEFTPSDNMTKLVLVTNKFCFDADYENTLNLFNQRLTDLGKEYYIDLNIIDNLPSNNNEKTLEQTSYSVKYQTAVQKMQKNGEQADIITMANIDDSSGYSDYDYFYLNEMIKPLDDFIISDTSLKKIISKTEWNLAKRNGKIYIVPTSSLSATGRGWEVQTSSITKLGITERDLQGEIWDILNKDKLADKKIYADLAAENWQSGSGNPLPPYNSEWYYDLITSCVGVKFNNSEPKAINIFEDEYMENSISTTYELSDLEDSDLCLYPTTVTNSNIKKNEDTTYIPIDEKLYLTGDLCGLGVATWTKNEEYAFDFISTLNTDKDLALLLNYGIEGKNYTLNSDGSVTVSDSQFESYKNPYYIFSNRRILPADSTINITDNLESAVISPICGFIFDTTDVEDKIECTNQVLVKYRDTLFKGKGDYEALKEKFLNDLKKAGIQSIVDEANRQIAEHIKNE